MSYHELSRGARVGITLAGGLLVLVLAGIVIYSCVLNSPERVAAKTFEAALTKAKQSEPETALRILDEVLASPHTARVESQLEARVGAEIIRITASLVKEPFTRQQIDQVGRLVRRYGALPQGAREGASRDTLLAALDRWNASLGPADQDVSLTLLMHASRVTDAQRSALYSQQIAKTRAAAGGARAELAPIQALEILMGQPHDAACVAKASEVMSKVVEHPSLLVEGEASVTAWLAEPSIDAALRDRVKTALEKARAAKGDTGDAAASLAKNPWNQYAAVTLARAELDKGALADADARVRKLAPFPYLVREARHLLGDIAFTEGKLDVADALYSELVESRLRPFQEASEAVERAAMDVQRTLEAQLRTGMIPDALSSKLQAATTPEAQQKIVLEHLQSAFEADPEIARTRQVLAQYQDVVVLSVSAGMTKIRRAQAGGDQRDRLLADAERMFLAVRSLAEGQPGFHLGLGEVFARLGKPAESDAELARVLDMKDPALSLQVAHVYRAIGSNQRAKEVASSVFESSSAPTKDGAAVLLSLLAMDVDEREQWLKKADPNSAYVKTALREVEAERFLRQGKHAECDRSYAEVAKAHLATATRDDVTGYNNAALAHRGRFSCTGDVTALRDAEATMERAYKAAADQSIVVHNYAKLLEGNALIRVLAKRVDMRELQLLGDEVSALVDALLDGPERTDVLADLEADPGWRRSAELFAQAEILAPNRPDAYVDQVEHAGRMRDEVAAAAIVERMKRVKTVDTSAIADAWKRWVSGVDDAKMLEGMRTVIARATAVIEKSGASAKTRAAALYVQSRSYHGLGVQLGEADQLERARAARSEAVKLWPALGEIDPEHVLDAAGLASDAKRWSQLRRERTAAAVVDKLRADKDPLFEKLKASALWNDIAARLRTATGRPGIDRVRLARALGQPDLEERVRGVFDDKLLRIQLEAAALASPAGTPPHEDLGYFERR